MTIHKFLLMIDSNVTLNIVTVNISLYILSIMILNQIDRLCGLVVRVLGYRSGGLGSIPGTTREKNVVGLERGALSLVSTN
jgi:hypothetical protein